MAATSLDAGTSFEPGVRINDIAGEVSTLKAVRSFRPARAANSIACGKPDAAVPDGLVLRFARSMNWGKSFQNAIDIDSSPGAASQSFFTMNVSPKSVISVAWLDGRDRGKRGGGHGGGLYGPFHVQGRIL